MAHNLGSGKLSKPKKGPDGRTYRTLDYPLRHGRGPGCRARVHLYGTSNQAQQQQAQLIAERDARLASGLVPVTDRPWREALDDWIAELARVVVPGVQNSARRAVERSFEWCSWTRLSEVELRKFDTWFAERCATRAPRTANYDLELVQRFMRWAATNRFIERDPLASITKAKKKKVHPARALAEDEIGRLLSSCQQLDKAARDHASGHLTLAGGTKASDWKPKSARLPFPQTLCIKFLLKVGTRYGEARQLSWANVHRETGVIRILWGTAKNRSERQFPIDSELGQLLDDLHAAARTTTGALPTASAPILLTPRGKRMGNQSNNLRRWFYRALDLAAIPRKNAEGEVVHIHALRHSFATRLLLAGVPMLKVKYLGGWKTTEVLEQIYAHIHARDALAEVEATPLPKVGTSESCGTYAAPLGARAPPSKVEAAVKFLISQGFRVERPKGLEPSTFSLGS